MLTFEINKLKISGFLARRLDILSYNKYNVISVEVDTR